MTDYGRAVGGIVGTALILGTVKKFVNKGKKLPIIRSTSSRRKK